jgi:hypothetical protein
MSTYWTEQAKAFSVSKSSEDAILVKDDDRANLSDYYSEQFQALHAALDPAAKAARDAEQAAKDQEESLIAATEHLGI